MLGHQKCQKRSQHESRQSSPDEKATVAPYNAQAFNRPLPSANFIEAPHGKRFDDRFWSDFRLWLCTCLCHVPIRLRVTGVSCLSDA